MDKFAEVAKAMVAPRVIITYVDAEGNKTNREIIITEVKSNLVVGLVTEVGDKTKAIGPAVSADTITIPTESKWHIRSFRTDRIENLIVIK